MDMSISSLGRCPTFSLQNLYFWCSILEPQPCKTAHFSDYSEKCNFFFLLFYKHTYLNAFDYFLQHLGFVTQSVKPLSPPCGRSSPAICLPSMSFKPWLFSFSPLISSSRKWLTLTTKLS